jgi:hypothetical protein
VNARLFDPVYCPTAFLSKIRGDRAPWLGLLAEIMRGYDRAARLTGAKKRAVFWVIYSVQLIFIAYFDAPEHARLAQSNAETLRWVWARRREIENLANSCKKEIL